MRKYALLYAILITIIFAGCLMFIAAQETIQPKETDYIAINEIAKLAALYWQTPDDLSRMDVAFRYSIIDNDGAVRYSSDGDLPNSLPSAIKRGFVPIDIFVDSMSVGKALIEANPDDAATEARTRLTGVIAITLALVVALNFAFLLALHNVLIKPFTRLQSFARKISVGRLDEPLPMDKNNVFGLFTQSFDLMRESLFEARKEQLQAERAKKELIASLNHDVKTPVTSIRLIAELLQASASDSATAEKLKTIEMKADQIDRLMNDMMHIALEELGELKVAVTSEDSGVLKGLFEDVDHLSRVRVGEIPICMIELDRMRMEQVAGNIIANSYKYAGTYIDVDFALIDELLRVDVIDYGNGVDPEELELITTKFYRGKNAIASQKEGEGLGLYVAKLMMDKMGGGLETFDRDDGFTTRLWIRLSR